MPSRNSAAKCWELASRSLKDTAAISTLRLSDIYAYASHPILSIARLTDVVQRARAGSFRHSCRQRQARKNIAVCDGMERKIKGSRRCRRLKVITGRRQTEWTGATRCPEVGRIL